MERSTDIKKSGVPYAVSAFPQIVPGIKSVPFLGVQGFMVTKFATAHGVESAGEGPRRDYMMQPAAQLALAPPNGRFPANLDAAQQVKDPDLKEFGAAGTGGVPMPNIPQMASVWQRPRRRVGPLDEGSGSIPARESFIGAQRSIAQKIG